jgi:ABC-2 type transport system permease protein
MLLLVLNAFWVVRSDAAFEEASAELAERIARMHRGQKPMVRRARHIREPFRLALAGRPETALLWKNLILLGRYSTWHLLVFLLPMIVIAGMGVATTSSHAEAVEVLAFLCVGLSGMAILLGPLMIRNDLRKDLANLPMLKAWPIRGAAIIRGEVLAPVLVLSVVVWVLIVGATALSAGLIVSMAVSARLLSAIGPRSIADLASYAAAAMILAPGLIAVNLVAQNGIAVLFPAWVTIGTPRSQGVEVIGQRMLLLAGTMFVLIGAVLPAALIGGLSGFVVYWMLRIVPVVVPAAIGSGVLVAECVLVTEALGRVLDRTDLTAIDAPE